ncbi:MAG TPA: SUMF1/EgtB/PvdO family nonheme iron enzyme, partial [Xanthobacteraceae bacterium]|nr:SUMF1/EgtB/PvdO family nonheme iron enzyme [Xanthobacteraceae bacterium]
MASMRVCRLTAFAIFAMSGVVFGQDARMPGTRVALVIGNGAYQQAPLTDASNDARAIAAALRDGSFDVVYLENARRAQIETAIDTFSRKLERGVTAVVYLSGHALQYQERNFFVPLDAKIDSASDVRREAIDMDLVVDPLIVARPSASTIILDASRANPWQKAVSDRVRGLATQESVEGVEFVYPAEPGKLIAENTRAASLFCTELIKAIRTPGLTFEAALRQTRTAVKRASGGEQVPWHSADVKDLVITPTHKPDIGPSDPVEAGYWDTIKNSEMSADFQAYLDSYPNGRFAALAHQRLDQIANKTSAKPADHDLVRPAAPPVIRDCEQCPELVLVPSGSFAMGAANSFPFEGPVHHVAIAKSFYLGRHEVTFDEWDACVEEGGCQYRPDDRGRGRGRRPVTDVDWQDAKIYVAWLSRKTGHTYRLPTESEWEYAARAGTTTAYPWGQAVDVDRANCMGCNPKPFNNTVD